MAAPSEGFWQRRGALGLYELLLTWWRHRVSFVISVVITLLALVLYYFTFVGERTTPIFNFIQRLEYDSLDTRFRYRPRSATPIDPRIVIVDIDQHSQEVLGKWPFSRTHFANMLDVLREDGAKVVAFDVTFSKPDHSAAPIRVVGGDGSPTKTRGNDRSATVRGSSRARHPVRRGQAVRYRYPTLWGGCAWKFLLSHRSRSTRLGWQNAGHLRQSNRLLFFPQRASAPP